MPPTNYVSLHTHSDYSIKDSIAKIPDLVNKARNLGMKSIAITDHGTISGWIKFYESCKGDSKKGTVPIKPIFGCEFYITDQHDIVKKIDNEIEELENKEDTFQLFDSSMNAFTEDDWKNATDPKTQIETLRKQKVQNRKSNHVIVLAKNQQGYRNIIKLSSMAWEDGFYYKPRIDMKLLEKYKEGLIVCSACLGGQIPRNILKGNVKSAEHFVKEYKRIFGDDFYLEMQLHEMPEQEKVNKQLIEFSKTHKVNLLITQDVHYLDKDDIELHRIMIMMKNKEKEQSLQKVEGALRHADIKKEVAKIANPRFAMLKESGERAKLKVAKEEEDSDDYFYEAKGLYFKTFNEMVDSWKQNHAYMDEETFFKAIDNTNKIADKIERIEVYSPKPILPKFDTGDLTPKEFFMKLIKEGAKSKIAPIVKGDPEKKAIYEKRLKEELEIICDLHFEEYFLIVWDFINWCRRNDVEVGPGRGSVGGSLIAFCIDLTQVDPIEYNLLFSRFINKTRSSAKFKLHFDDIELEKK
jgi:DNA polymerase-3 subunit alpha